MKIKSAQWFSDMSGFYGMVVGENDAGERKCYMKRVKGMDLQEDIRDVLENGAPVYLDQLKEAVGKMTVVDKPVGVLPLRHLCLVKRDDQYEFYENGLKAVMPENMTFEGWQRYPYLTKGESDES